MDSDDLSPTSTSDTVSDHPEDYKIFDKALDPKIQNYLKWDISEYNTALIKELVLNKDLLSLRFLLSKRLELPSGGIRGYMYPGFNAVNDVVVIQSGQGLIKYLENKDQDGLKENGIVVGYDGRYNSRRFAEVTATIFLNQNYPVKMFGKEVITPFVPLAITKYGCVAGVMICGGGHPKEFNGYKIFGPNGCQVVPPVDKEIEEKILDNLEPNEESWNTDILEVAEMLTDPYLEVVDSYLQLVSDSVLQKYKEIAAKTVLKFVYTSLHGVGYEVFKKVADNHCLMIEPVPKQVDIDSEFPSVKYPDPVQPKTLDRAKAHADKNKIKYIVATDPDGGRMVFAEKQKGTGTWKTYDSNEIGALLAWWALDQYKQKEPAANMKNVYMIASTVSSKILRSMAKEEKFNFVETLPGFRWIANQAYDLKGQGKKAIFSFSENNSFMFSDDLLDKDGVQACIQMMTMICCFETKQLTLSDQMAVIYAQYDYHIYLESYFNTDDYDGLESIFEKLRMYQDTSPPKTDCHCVPEAYKDSKQAGCCCNPYPPSANIKKYPKSVGDGKFQISQIRDITLGFDNNEPSRKSVLPAQPDMQMITFGFVNGLVATIRVNPGEPKLRYCAELIVKPKDMKQNEGIRLVNEMVHRIIHEFICPTKNGLSLPN